MLELKNIKKSYQTGTTRQEVLKDINIKFRKSEFTSILGTSGSGKTTLLNIIGGLDKYDSGDLVIEGISTKDYKARDWDTYRNYRVGFIFQSYNLIMHQSVYSNVEIALTLTGVSKRQRKKRVLEALEKVGLKDHVYKKPTQLSGGQMQRVAIARALVNDPEIILADEPTGALDSNTSIQIMDLLKEIANDKLIIMVTHNPDLAKQYSTRIIELKDGVIINDNNPYDGSDDKVTERKTKKTSMSFSTSLSLSFNNLLTKKGRTFLTAFAGSIGIIGIALILSLSNGVSKYISNMEKESLSDYPIEIEKSSYDLMGALTASVSSISSSSTNREEGKLYSQDDIVSQLNISDKGLLKKNNLKEFKKFVDNNDDLKQYTTDIICSYKLNLQVYSKDYDRVNPSNLIADNSKNTNSTNTVFSELVGGEETIKSKYQVLAGSLPKDYSEVVLVVGKDNVVNDSILYSLKIKDKKDLKNDVDEFRKNSQYKVNSTDYSYESFLNKEYKVILNTDYYKEENGIFVDYSNDSNYMKNVIDNGLNIKIVGVVKNENETASFIGYKQDLTVHIVNEISKTNIYKRQMEDKNVNVLTGMEYDGVYDTLENTSEELGIYDIEDPSKISLYPKDYDSKQEIVKIIDDYNKEKKDNNQGDLTISYTDLMKTLASGVTNVVRMVSYVLIGFVAISLIVSSIMISIITYISVLERTKEIGILRAIGASKKDIKRVFRSETIIEGLVAGALGIGITLLLNIPINLIVSHTAKIENIAKLPFINAVVLIGLSVLLNVIAGSRPSSIAAKKNPVESLRSE